MARLTQYLSSRPLWILVLLLVVLRFVALDADPPSYNQSGINVTDEPYYCLNAIDNFHKYQGTYLEGFHDDYKDFMYLHNEMPVFISLVAFGNTYFGLRVFPVICSLLAILFMLLASNKRNSWIINLLICLLLLSDYYFFLFSRYQSPQIYSILWISLIYLFVSKSESRSWYMIVATALAMLQVVLVYPYTVFIFLSIMVWSIIEYIIFREKSPLVQSVIGGMLGFVAIFGILQLNGYELTDYIDFVTGRMSVRDELDVGFGFKSVIQKLLQLPFTNLFRYNPLWWLSIGAFSLVSVFNFTKLSKFNRFLFVSICCLFITSYFISSYPFKKWIIALPTGVLTLSALAEIEIYASLKRRLLFGVGMLVFATISVYGILVTNLSEYWSGFVENYPFEELSPMIQTLLYILCFVSLFFIITHFWVKKTAAIRAVLAFTILGHIAMIGVYLFQSTYEYRDILMDNSKAINNSMVIGQFSHAHCFYSNARPTYNPYDLSFGFVENDTVKKYIDNYSETSKLSYYIKNLHLDQMDATSVVRGESLFVVDTSSRILKLYMN